MIRLEIGPSGYGCALPADDWYTLSIRRLNRAFRPSPPEMNCRGATGMDRVGTWGGPDALPFNPGSFDLIYSSHCLEHIPWDRSLFALQQASFLLKRGGKVEIHVPDFRKVVDAYLARRPVSSWFHNNPERNPFKSIAAHLFAIGPNEGDFHKACFDYEYLRELMLKAGFINLSSPVPPRGWPHGWQDLSITGEKC